MRQQFCHDFAPTVRSLRHSRMADSKLASRPGVYFARRDRIACGKPANYSIFFGRHATAQNPCGSEEMACSRQSGPTVQEHRKLYSLSDTIWSRRAKHIPRLTLEYSVCCVVSQLTCALLTPKLNLFLKHFISTVRSLIAGLFPEQYIE